MAASRISLLKARGGFLTSGEDMVQAPSSSQGRTTIPSSSETTVRPGLTCTPPISIGWST